MDCVFCGARPKPSGEHVWPEWLKKVMPPKTGEKWTVRHGMHRVGDDRVIQFDIVPFTQTVNCVCVPCNNEWMNEIENDAKPYLTTIIQGRGRDLPPVGRKKIATWIALRVLILQYTHPKLITAPRSQYEWLYEKRGRNDREAPPGMFIWLGAYTNGNVPPNYAHSALGAKLASGVVDPAQHLGYTATFTVGHLVAQVVSLERTRKDGAFKDSRQVRSVFIRLWPPTTGTKTWPPRKVMDNAGVRAFAELFA